MFRVVVGCLIVNAAGIVVSATNLFLLRTSSSGFTITTPRATHYIGGGVLPAAVLMCLMSLAITVCLAWSLTHPR